MKDNKKPKDEIAAERINILLREADRVSNKNDMLAKRYVTLARKISMKTKTKIPKKLKRKYCKHCHSYFKQGINCRVRINNNMVLYYCFDCKQYTRIPFIKEKSSASS